MRESEQLRRHHGLPLPLEIQHDEFTIDIPENQILRTACERMLTVPRVDAESQRMLRRLLRDFADVTPLSRGDPIPDGRQPGLTAAITWPCVWPSSSCRATSVEHEFGGVAVNGFLLDMPKLFEDFVTVALREALVPAYGGRVADQDRNHLDEAGQVVLRPDIVWKIGGSARRRHRRQVQGREAAGYPNADLYQLLAYCTVLGLRAATWSTPKATRSPPATSYAVRHRDLLPCS